MAKVKAAVSGERRKGASQRVVGRVDVCSTCRVESLARVSEIWFLASVVSCQVAFPDELPDVEKEHHALSTTRSCEPRIDCECQKRRPASLLPVAVWAFAADTDTAGD